MWDYKAYRAYGDKYIVLKFIKIGLSIVITVLLQLQGVTINLGFEISLTVILFSVHFLLLKLRVKIELTGRERIRPLSILAYLIHATSYVSSFEYTRCQRSRTVQIKNIKLHIVTDIKVTINSLSVFGFRYLVGGRVTTILKKTMSKFSPDLWSYVLYTCMSYKGMYTYHTCMHKRACVYTLYLCMYIVCLYVNWVFMWTKSNVNVSYVWME